MAVDDRIDLVGALRRLIDALRIAGDDFLGAAKLREETCDLGFADADAAGFRDYKDNGSSNLYLFDLTNGNITRLTNMQPGEFALAMDRYEGEPGLADRMGDSGRQFMEREYSWDAVGARFRAALAHMAPGGVLAVEVNLARIGGLQARDGALVGPADADEATVLEVLDRSAQRVPRDIADELLAKPYPREYYKSVIYREAVPVLYAITPRFREQGEALMARLPVARVSVYPDAGHALFVYAADRFNAEIEHFVEGIH